MISLYSSKVVDNSAKEPETKRSRTTGSRSLRSNPLYQHLENALDAESLSVLVKEAISKPIQMNAGHAVAESKCFCFNGYIKWDKNLQPEFDSKIVDLLPGNKAKSWGSLSKSVQKAVINLFHIAGLQSHKIGADLPEKSSWVAFELIRVPLHKGKKVPELEWHRDGGYYDNFNNPCSCFADYSTIFMLADPDDWEGGDLELQRNGEKKRRWTFARWNVNINSVST